MKMKRILAASAALAVCAGLSMPAYAASGKLKLYTQPISELGINGGDGLWHRGDLYGIGTSDGIEKLISITGKDAKKWRSIGDFSYSDVTVNGDVDWNNLGLYSDTNELFNWADDGSSTAIYPFDFNGTDEITIRNTSFDRNGWMYVTDDGYILNINDGTIKGDCRGFTYEQVDPDGEFDFAMTNCSWWAGNFGTCDEKYNAYFLYGGEPHHIDQVDGIEVDWDEYDIKLVGITKDCTEEEIYSGTSMYFGLSGCGKGYVQFWTQYAPKGAEYHLFLTGTGETIDFSLDDSGNMTISEMHGDKFVASWDTGLALMQISNEAGDNGLYAVTTLSDTYKDISSEDGEIYLVQTQDDKWGYINSDGELLATYDDAGSFIGKYAPVVKDGKAFLINRNFKRVSEMIDADGVRSCDKGLYVIELDGEYSFMTYADGASDVSGDEQGDTSTPVESTAEPSEPADTVETTDTAPAVNDNTDENKANPDTGAASCAVVVGLTAVAGGVLLMSRKHR